MDHELLFRIIEQYFEKSMTSIYMKHSESEVDFYKWLPTNKFVYKHDNYHWTFRLWQSVEDILLEELSNNITEEIDKEIIKTLMDRHYTSLKINRHYALPKIKQSKFNNKSMGQSKIIRGRTRFN
jgi:hypothetical protein